ncbi:DUF397 domain-containing protein [Streptomyces sp. NPDC059568]|uniref:DUF397 domain-containing protein n=1 Tax=Streptomyces sp. NPDC059568 TaxID=3346868 RepID=UPI0036AAE292
MSTFISNASTLNVEWRKSSYSGADSNCVETALLDTVAAVRDSKAPTSPALCFSTGGWSSFIAAVKDETLAA